MPEAKCIWIGCILLLVTGIDAFDPLSLLAHPKMLLETSTECPDDLDLDTAIAVADDTGSYLCPIPTGSGPMPVMRRVPDVAYLSERVYHMFAGQCFVHASGTYWNLQYCFQHSIKQFHKVIDAGTILLGIGPDYDPANPYLVGSLFGTATPPTTFNQGTPPAVRVPLRNPRFEYIPSDDSDPMPKLVGRYTDGFYCMGVGDGREVQVIYECRRDGPDGGAPVLQLDEPSSCKYRLYVRLKSLCELDEMRVRSLAASLWMLQVSCLYACMRMYVRTYVRTLVCVCVYLLSG